MTPGPISVIEPPYTPPPCISLRSLFFNHAPVLSDIPPVSRGDTGSELGSVISFLLILTETFCSQPCPPLVSYATGKVEKRVHRDTWTLIFQRTKKKFFVLFCFALCWDLLTQWTFKSFQQALLCSLQNI